jgi:L-2-hydroxycarboxylate dehydrogenase (NAD+)
VAEETEIRVQAERLKAFCGRVFEKLDVPPEDAEVTADNLVLADLRGISSHGVARLRRYVKGLQDGVMLARPKIELVHETTTTALIDGGAGLGQPVSVRAMRMAMRKAREAGAGFVAVRNSNHYGIAGYYALMALKEEMIGISMTNAAVLVLPTFGRDAMLGTNPISVAAPAGEERAFVLDMATSTVPRGKLEVYDRQEKPLPLGWATDDRGVPGAEESPGAGGRGVAATGRRRRVDGWTQGIRPGVAGGPAVWRVARGGIREYDLSQDAGRETSAGQRGALFRGAASGWLSPAR